MEKLLLSIIIPVYNVADYLEKCIHSILSQDYTNFECILIDDGSTDGSSQLCDSIQNTDKRIKVIHKNNEGVAAARNRGISESKGDFIIFVDSDDTLKPGILLQVANKIKETNSEIVVFGYERISENGNIIYSVCPNNNFTKQIMQNDYSDLTFLLWNKVYKRTLFNKINLTIIEGISFSEDSYLTLALQKLTENISFLNTIGYQYLCRSSSVTQRMSQKNHLDRLKAVQLIDSLYSNFEKRPASLKYIKFDTKFFYIDPNIFYTKKDFLINCEEWRKVFNDCNNIKTKKIGTKKMALYVILIRLHFDQLAYIFYSKKNKDYNKQ